MINVRVDKIIIIDTYKPKNMCKTLQINLLYYPKSNVVCKKNLLFYLSYDFNA